MGALISALANFLGGSFAARWLSTKLVATFLFVVVLPIILFNVSVEIAEAIFSLVTATLPVPPTVQQFTGLAGWFLMTAHIPESISIIVSALAGRFTLNALLGLR